MSAAGLSYLADRRSNKKVRRSAAHAAHASAPSGSRCGWLGSLLGQCCSAPDESGDVEVKVERSSLEEGDHVLIESWGPSWGSINDDQHLDILAINTLRRARPCGLYLISNSKLKAEKQSGVAYRYSKCYSDKVWGESPALWGDIVEGVEDGNGWLQVGDYFLPMVFEGMPIITPILGFKLPSTPIQRENCIDWSRCTDLDHIATSETTTSPHAATPALAAGLRRQMVELREDSFCDARPVLPPPPLPALQIRVERDLPPVEEEPDLLPVPEERLQDAWAFQPSVGTWFQHAPTMIQRCASEPERQEAEEEKQITDDQRLQGKEEDEDVAAYGEEQVQKKAEDGVEDEASDVPAGGSEIAIAVAEHMTFRKHIVMQELSADDISHPSLKLDLNKSMPITPSTIAPESPASILSAYAE